MFDHITLTRPNLTVDPVNDGRHKLDPAIPNDRESIPVIVHLPDEGIAFFSYTWVDKNSMAGAVFFLFGPGVGPEPLVFGMPDRKVPEDMDFSDWQIDSFSMQQDLKFGTCVTRYSNDRVKLDFTFEGSHPPYAYSANARGCPPYCANDRIEQSGRARGVLEFDGKRIEFDTTGHRDHSWGVRDWQAFQNYRWFQGQAGPDVSVHFWHLNALGVTSLLGYVFKDGLMAEVTDVTYDLQFGEGFKQKRLVAELTDEAGRKTSVIADFYAHAPLIPSPDITLTEAAARTTIDGTPGVGWLEVAMPTAYLEHIRANPAYLRYAGGEA